MSGTKGLVVPGAIAGLLAGILVYSQSRPNGISRAMPAASSFRLLLGVTDTVPTTWDGRIAVRSGSIVSIRGWRFAPADAIDSASSWKCATRNVSMRWLGKSGPVTGAGPVLENGVIVAVSPDQPDERLEVDTAQGSFSFRAVDIPWGEQRSFLEGRVVVDRVPTTTQLTDSPDDQDFPAIAQTADAVYVSYVEFAHGDRKLEAWQADALSEPPKDFDVLARPAGGDQVFLMCYSKSERVWSPPLPVSAAKQDVVRTAVAVDGQNRVWVFWAASRDGNYDIYAKALANGRWSREIRITSDSGTDLNPVAATDSSGRIWVAWQGFRHNNLEILAAVQTGDGFSNETTVSFSKQSDWDPSIAASADGQVTVAWDTYEKGDYDVYFRGLRLKDRIVMDAPVAAASSLDFEARSSIAFDTQNRLWVAYETSGAKWGKDFGAYETTGMPLYLDQTVAVKCFQGGQVLAPVADLAAALRNRTPLDGRRVKKTQSVTLPDPQLAAARPPSQFSTPALQRSNSFPRIAADPAGTVYLAFRTPAGRGWLGGSWTQRLMCLQGSAWIGPMTVPNTDGWLDARPAMAVIDPGDLLMIAASDHRQSAAVSGNEKGKKSPVPLEALSADLYAVELHAGSSASPKLEPAAPVPSPSQDPEVAREREQVQAMRDYRVSLNAGRFQVVRGEFHRHTEISGDGGGDGALTDAYRYLIDVAAMDWAGCCDHDNGGGREYSWWLVQKLTDAYNLGSRYVPMFSYERSLVYPEGHRNVVFARRGIRPLPKLPTMAPDSKPTHAPDTQMLYRYLRHFGGISASHTSGTTMGTDWRDNDPGVEPVVEIYQGDRQSYEMPGAPRAGSSEDAIGGWRPLGFVSLALQKGYRLGFQASSDHTSTHMSYCNLWVTAPTRDAIMEAFRKRRIYGATDNILADVRSGGHFMGEEFTTSEPPVISVKLRGTAAFARVHIIRNNEYVHSVTPNEKKVDFVWKDTSPVKGKTSYYYVRGEQVNGELVWVSPIWITYQ